MLEILTKRELIDLVGAKLYEDISSFLYKVLATSTDDAELEIFKKANIIRLLLSFSNKSELRKPKLWRDIISRLDEKQKRILESEGLSLSSKGSVLSLDCLKYEFEKNDLAYVEDQGDIQLRKAISVCEAPSSPFKSLKDFQIEVYQEARSELKVPRSRFIVQMPTGSGKTRTAMEVVASHLNSSDRVGCVIWLAHSVDLIEQAAASFEEVWEHIGQFNVLLRVLDGGRAGLKGLDETTPSFVVATFQSLVSCMNSGRSDYDFLVNSASLVVCDEAHMSIAPRYNQLVASLLSKGSSLIGLTATPGRHAEDAEGNKELSNFYFNKIIGLSAPENMSVFDNLRQIGVMSYTQMYQIRGSSLKLTKSDIRKIQEEFSIPKSLLNKLANEELRNIEIIAKLKSLIEKDGYRSIILFACSVDHSKFIASVCSYLGISSAHVDGTTPLAERQIMLTKFRQGEIQLLSNFGVLSTGFDAPKTDVVFIARPTNSIVLYSQMIGRGLRGPEIGGTERCLIVNVKDNLVGLPDPDEIYDYFSEYYSKN